MILINLLPPEMRRRKTEFQFNPMMGGALGGLVACILMVGAYLWLRGEVAEAMRIIDEKTADLADKTAKAAIVTERQALIADFEKRSDTIHGLLDKKMYWARTIDDFSKQLAGEWTQPGFKVSAGDLSIADIPVEKHAGAGTEVLASFRWRYKIVGDKDQKSGDYIKSFFDTIEHSQFWARHGFQSKPDKGYDGDRPRWNNEINKVIVEGALDWQRYKLAESVKKGAKAAPQGN